MSVPTPTIVSLPGVIGSSIEIESGESADRHTSGTISNAASYRPKKAGV
jgi:hypothetical protein